MRNKYMPKLLRLNKELQAINKELESIGVDQGKLKTIVDNQEEIEQLRYIRVYMNLDRYKIGAIHMSVEKNKIFPDWIGEELSSVGKILIEQRIKYLEEYTDRLLGQNENLNSPDNSEKHVESTPDVPDFLNDRQKEINENYADGKPGKDVINANDIYDEGE